MDPAAGGSVFGRKAVAGQHRHVEGVAKKQIARRLQGWRAVSSLCWRSGSLAAQTDMGGLSNAA